MPKINHINCLATKNVEGEPCIMHFGAPAEKMAMNPIIIRNKALKPGQNKLTVVT